MDGILDQGIKRYAGATGRDLHIDAPLSNMTIGYRPQRLIAPEIYPAVPVDKQSNTYYIWNKADWLSIPTVNRAPGAPTPLINFAVSSGTYFAHGYGLGVNIPWEDLDNADSPLQVATNVSNLILDKLALAWEARCATLLTTTTNHGSSTSLTNRWSDPVNGSPVSDIFTGMESVRISTGLEPNTMILSGIAYNNIRQHPEVIDFVRGKGTQTGGPVTAADLQGAFFPMGGKVLIGGGVKNVAAENATASMVDIWSTSCILLHVAGAPGLMTPSHGYTMQWRPANFPAPFSVMRTPDAIRKADLLEVLHFQEEKVVGTDLGYLIVNC